MEGDQEEVEWGQKQLGAAEHRATTNDNAHGIAHDVSAADYGFGCVCARVGSEFEFVEQGEQQALDCAQKVQRQMVPEAAVDPVGFGGFGHLTVGR